MDYCCYILFPKYGLGQEKAQDDILELPPNNKIFTREVLIDMFVYGTWMAACCLAIFVVVVFGKGDGNLGHNCNTTSNGCSLVFEGRSGAFAAFTWCALLLAWECIHMRRSVFKTRPESELPWYKQLGIDIWENKFLFWSIVGGFVSVFPVVYIPVINDKVFLHGPITWEWGLAIGFTILFLIGAEVYKWIKRIYLRNVKAKDTIAELSVFEKYISMSKSNTMDV